MVIAVRSTGSSEAATSHNKPSLLAGPLDTTAPWLQVNGQTNVDGDLEGLARLGKPVLRFTRSLLHSIRAVVVVLSSRMKDSLAEYDFNLPDTELIPNGVDISRFHPTGVDTSIGERAQIVVCISKLRYEKGIDVLLQACGLPCVATRVSGSEDIIHHGVNGLLVESEDYQSMAQALLTLLSDPALALQYGYAARETIEKHYSFEQIVDRYIEIYQRIADHRREITEDRASSKISSFSS